MPVKGLSAIFKANQSIGDQPVYSTRPGKWDCVCGHRVSIALDEHLKNTFFTMVEVWAWPRDMSLECLKLSIQFIISGGRRRRRYRYRSIRLQPDRDAVFFGDLGCGTELGLGKGWATGHN